MPAHAAQAEWDAGWLHSATHCPSPNCGPRPEATEIDLLVIKASVLLLRRGCCSHENSAGNTTGRRIAVQVGR